MSNLSHSLDVKRRGLIPKVVLIPNLSLNNMVDELLIEIFVLLPSKKAIECKSVCKRWNSLISVNILNHHHLVFKINRWCINIEHCFPRQQSRRFVDSSFLPFPETDMRPLATYVDLMLCCQDNKDLSCSTNFYIVNLLTEKWIALPPAPSGLLVDCSATGFLCQKNTNRFRIVRLPGYFTGIPGYFTETATFEIKIQVFSSEKCEWKWLNVSSPWIVKNTGFKKILVYKGLLHWIIANGIFVYDPFLDPQQFSRFIELPAGIITPGDYCGASQGGHLYVAQFTPPRHDRNRANSSVSVWKLEEDYSWSLCHKMYLRQLSFIGTPLAMYASHIPSKCIQLGILALDPADVNILYLTVGHTTVRCDMKKHAVLECIGEETTCISSFELVINRSGPTPLPLFPDPHT